MCSSTIDGACVWLAFTLIGDQTNFQNGLCITFFFICNFGMVAVLGQTPGGRLLGLFVVDNRKFSPPQRRFPAVSWGSAFLRAISLPFTISITLLTNIALLSPKRRHFSDWISGTRVIQTRLRDGVPKKRIFSFWIPVFATMAFYGGIIYFVMKLPPGMLQQALKSTAAARSISVPGGPTLPDQPPEK